MWSLKVLATLLLSSTLAAAKGIKAGQLITFRATTTNYTNFYVAHTAGVVNIQKIPASNTTAQWKVNAPLNSTAGAGCFSFTSVDSPTLYIRNFNYHLLAQPTDGTALFKNDATYCFVKGHAGRKTKSLYSLDFPTRFFRHYNEVMYIATNGGPNAFDSTVTYAPDTSFMVKRVRARTPRSVEDDVLEIEDEE